MTGQVALVHEQGQEFAILAVKNSVIPRPRLREGMGSCRGESFRLVDQARQQ